MGKSTDKNTKNYMRTQKTNTKMFDVLGKK